MNKNSRLIYFGPLTVFVEWLGIILSFGYVQKLNLNQALSVYSVAPQPLAAIYRLTMVTAGSAYFVFSLALRVHNKYIPYAAAFAGLLLGVTGLIPFHGDGRPQDWIHNTCIYLAVLGYGLMILLLRKHPLKKLAQSSTVALVLFLTAVLITLVCSLVLHRYIAVAEISVLVVIQIWTIHFVWHSRPMKQKLIKT